VNNLLANGSRIAAIAAVLALGFGSLDSDARPAQGAAGNAQAGKAIFTAQKCGTCHGNDAQGGSGQTAGPQIGPPPLALPMFTDVLRNPKDPMPAFSTQDISDAQAADLYAYLKSMGAAPAAAQTSAPAPGNADNGKMLYVKVGCYECHDRDAEGAGTGPRLAPNLLPWAAFSHQVRLPANSMPPYTTKVLSDTELADIYAFLQTIPKPPAVSTITLQ
jgi:mono/diheme cytochrome c family protein